MPWWMVAEDLADEGERRDAEEILLATIDATGDDKLTRFAIRLALSGHLGIPHENEFDFLSEAEAVFLLPKPKKTSAKKSGKEPTPIKCTKAGKRKATVTTPQAAEAATAA